jgi:hypothetical protein
MSPRIGCAKTTGTISVIVLNLKRSVEHGSIVDWDATGAILVQTYQTVLSTRPTEPWAHISLDYNAHNPVSTGRLVAIGLPDIPPEIQATR